MGFGFTLWVLLALLSISFTATHPLWALGTAAAGGVLLGLYLWRQCSRRPVRPPPSGRSRSLASWVYRYEIFLLGPPFAALFFANRLFLALSFLAVALLVFLWTCRTFSTGRFSTGSPLDLPIALLLITSGVSLCASVDLLLSANRIFTLIASIAFLYALVDNVDSERTVRLASRGFLMAGTVVALAVFLVMQFPGAKLPLISRLYHYLPDFLPRWIHSNYIGGTLVFFFPLAFLRVVAGQRDRVSWISAVTMGVGVLMTQSRGALLGTVVALILTGVCWKRRFKWELLVAAGAGGLVLYVLGVEALLDPIAGSGLKHNLEGRQALWQRAVYIIQDFPFTGIGIYTFPVVVDLLYPLFPAGPSVWIPHAHNLFLQVAVDIGLPGFVAFCALLGAWGGMVGEVLHTARSVEGKRHCEILALGLAGGMLAHLVYVITDAITLGEKSGVIFWVVLGLTAAVWRSVKEAGAVARGPEPG